MTIYVVQCWSADAYTYMFDSAWSTLHQANEYMKSIGSERHDFQLIKVTLDSPDSDEYI